EMNGPLRGLLRLVCLVGLGGVATFSADPALVPMGVCEVLHDLSAQDGKTLAVLGRYSFRTTGRYIGEQACNPDAGAPPMLWLQEDNVDGPKPPGQFELDGVALAKKWADMQKHTSLGKFRFGSQDYDRWAVVYGKVETRKGDDAKKAAA